MHRLSSYSRSLQEVFEGSVTVRYIASSLASFDTERTAGKIQKWLIRKDYDQVGVRRDGLVVGYALARELTSGALGDHVRDFSDAQLLPIDTPMLEALQLVRNHRRVFITVLGAPHGIITPGDVVKPPVLLWLFGLLTIFEMQITRLMRAVYPEDSWISILPAHRVKNARRMFEIRRQNETDVDLADCLFLPDKQRLVAASPALRGLLGFSDRAEATRVTKGLTELRNMVSHAHDISHAWPDFLDVAQTVEDLIHRCEQVSSRDLRTPLV